VRFFILVVVFGLVGWTMARTIRDRACRSPALRRRLLIRACIALILGLVIALWLPGRVPETPGSPATIVALLVLWVIGGGLVFVGVATIVGALLARPPADGHPKPPAL
jgi:MFS family permease